MDKRRFLINLLSNCLSVLSGVGISFILTPYIVETLGKETYAFYPLVTSFSLYVSVITTALNSLFGRYAIIYLERKRTMRLNELYSTVFIANLGLSFFLSIFLSIFLINLDFFLHIPSQYYNDVKILFVLTFIGLLISIISSVFSIIGIAINRFDLIAIRKIISDLLNLIVVISFFYFFVPKIYFLGISSVITMLYLAITNSYLTRKFLPNIKISYSFFNKRLLIGLISISIWNSLLSFSDMLFVHMDLLIANTKLGLSEMGELSLTKQFPSLFSLLAGIIIPIFIPYYLKYYSTNNLTQLKSIIDFSFKFCSLVLLIPLGIVIGFSESFYHLWTPNENISKLSILLSLALGKYLIQLTIEPIFSIYITLNKIKYPAIWAVSMSIVNILLMFVLLSYTDLGVFAVPLSSFIIGTFSQLTFNPIYGAKVLGFKYSYFYKKIFYGLTAFFITLLLCGLVKIFELQIDSWLYLFLYATTCMVLSFVINSFLFFPKYQLLNLIYSIKNKIFDYVKKNSKSFES